MNQSSTTIASSKGNKLFNALRRGIATIGTCIRDMHTRINRLIYGDEWL